MKQVSFTKMHGIGNDYIYFTEYPCPPEQLPELSRQLSDRHYSIGGDGIILALPSEVADFKMIIFNADGSEARMCGNGSRCVGKLVSDKRLTEKDTITLETLSGIKTIKLHKGTDGKVDKASVDMGQALVSPPVAIQLSDGRSFSVIPVNMGNPHAVIFIDCDPDEYDVHGIGKQIENHGLWPDRANVEFAHIIDHSHIKVRVWERGSGETMACGTGACATAAAALKQGLCDPEINISLPGGDLEINIDQASMNVVMTGSASTSFEGTIIL